MSWNNVIPGWMLHDVKPEDVPRVGRGPSIAPPELAPVLPIGLPREIASSDWESIFDAFGTTTLRCAAASPEVSISGFNRYNVAQVIALVNGEKDGAAWLGLFELRDGRYAFIKASCDCTGWDCRRWGFADVAASVGDLIRASLIPEDRRRLGVGHHEPKTA